jgi:putative FmdB family regulatory protein
MPTYEYVCTACDNQWEEIQKISEPPLEACPKCGKSTAKRQISGGNFILKGGGWYADLYSSTPKKGADKANKKEGSSSESASSSASASSSSDSSSSGSSSKTESKAPSTAPPASSGSK